MNAKHQNPESILGLIRSDAKAICDWCNNPRSTDLVLKRCRGCNVTWYCSKKCQSGAWPKHKFTCTSRSSPKVPPMYRVLGHSTLAELSKASQDWAEAHEFTLFMIATVLVEMAGGVDAVRNKPFSVVFGLGPPANYDGSPSTAFTLTDMDIKHKDDLGGILASQWSLTAVVLRSMLAKRFSAAHAHPDVVGVLPVTFVITDAPGLVSGTSFPLLRPAQVPPGGIPGDEHMRNALLSLVPMCAGAVNAGTVFRIPADADQAVPDIGRLQRTGRGWVWTPPPPLAPPRNVNVEFFRSLGNARSALVTHLDAFAVYHQLWPYHSLRINASRGSSSSSSSS